MWIVLICKLLIFDAMMSSNPMREKFQRIVNSDGLETRLVALVSEIIPASTQTHKWHTQAANLTIHKYSHSKSASQVQEKVLIWKHMSQ